MEHKETYEIILRAEGGQGGSGNSKNDKTDKPVAKTDKMLDMSSDTITRTQNIKKAMLASVSFVTSTAFSAQATHISYVQITTAHNEHARRQQLGLNVARRAADVGISMLGGASLAASLGVSGPFGAVVGGVAMLTKSVINLAEKQALIDANKQVEDNQIRMMNIRAGADGNRNRE